MFFFEIRRPGRVLFFVGNEIEFLETPPKGGSRDAELLRRFRLVEAGAAVHLVDMLLLEYFQLAAGFFRRLGPCLGKEEIRGQIPDREHRLPGQGHGAFYDILQLPDVAGEGIGEERIEKGVVDPGYWFPELGGNKSDEVFDQEGDVFLPVAQGWELNHHHLQAIKEVLTEAACGHHSFDILVGGGDDADIDRRRCDSAYPQEAAFLDHPQHLDLHRDGRLTYFIKKYRAAVCGLQQPKFRADGAGKGAFFMTEEFIGDEFFAERPAVKGNEGMAGPVAVRMERSCDQLLAGAAFTLDQDIAVEGGNLPDGLEDFLHGRGTANNLPKTVRAVCRLIPD